MLQLEFNTLAELGWNSVLDEARRSITCNLRNELEPLGIRVVSVTSGPVARHELTSKVVLDERYVRRLGRNSRHSQEHKTYLSQES